MFVESDSGEVLGNTDERSVEKLLESGVIRPTEDGEGHEVVLDNDQWTTEKIAGLNVLDAALGGAMRLNEVAWCGDPVGGEEFTDAYTEEFEGVFDTHEEYEASIIDYVDCGDGRP